MHHCASSVNADRLLKGIPFGSLFLILLSSCLNTKDNFNPGYRLIPAEKTEFNSFVDCNMAEARVGDTFRIFPGKYGEDPLWGDAAHLRFADGMNADGAFRNDTSDFISPSMPPNVPPGQGGLHGAVWFYWGPSVHRNTYLECWVMLMGKVVGPSWKGSQVYIAFNRNSKFSDPEMSQEWTKPQLLYEKPGYKLWYPSLQPQNTEEDIVNKFTSLLLGKKTRFFVKSLKPYNDQYASEFII